MPAADAEAMMNAQPPSLATLADLQGKDVRTAILQQVAQAATLAQGTASGSSKDTASA